MANISNTKSIDNFDEKFNNWLKINYNKTWSEIEAEIIKNKETAPFVEQEKEEYFNEFINEQINN